MNMIKFIGSSVHNKLRMLLMRRRRAAQKAWRAIFCITFLPAPTPIDDKTCCMPVSEDQVQIPLCLPRVHLWRPRRAIQAMPTPYMIHMILVMSKLRGGLDIVVWVQRAVVFCVKPSKPSKSKREMEGEERDEERERFVVRGNQHIRILISQVSHRSVRFGKVLWFIGGGIKGTL